MSAQQPPLSPIAAPLGHRKRRHSEVTVIKLDGEDERAERKLVAVGPTVTKVAELVCEGDGVSVRRSRVVVDRGARDDEGDDDGGDEDDDDDNDDDEDGDGDGDSDIENILDHAEISPWKPLFEGEVALSKEDTASLRERLLSVGPEQFIREALSSGAFAPRLLGTAFGIDPRTRLGDDDGFLLVLGRGILRAFCKRQKLPAYNTVDDAAALLRDRKNVLVITGAGISTSLGIPDFRSKESGFYSKVENMGYQEPEDVFDIYTFDENPKLFYSLAGDILPDLKRFSPTHAFVRLLQDKGKLLTNYTQNIDNIEELAGIERSRLIQCHGSFATASCRKCKHQVKGIDIFDDIRRKRVSRCKRCREDMANAAVTRKSKKRKHSKNGRRKQWEDSSSDGAGDDDDIPEPGVMKPDITFFGEQLPDDFFDRFTEHDVRAVDLVVVIGTSLKVAPVSEMPNYLPHHVPHIYISRDPVEHVDFDIQLLGECDDVVFELCRRAGWELRHDMIPADFCAHVEPREGSSCRWNIMKGQKGGRKEK